jgi:peptidoglycan/LPS O-acetylase OafA/YrhL
MKTPPIRKPTPALRASIDLMSTLSPQEHNFHPAYRADIDGLRALAILPVVAFHASSHWPKGGFVGVDIFFVISGYLISCIIFKSLATNDFRFNEFYAHRIKRIFPALILVLATCYVLGWFLLLPDEYKQLGKHIAAGAGYVQNFVLWQEHGYFDTKSDLKPLLHLWSLAIEEQFYLIYPLLIWAAWRSGANILTVVVVLGIASFTLNIVGINQYPVKTYFAPQTRFWELMAGGALAYFRVFQCRPAWLTCWPNSCIFNRLLFTRTPEGDARREALASFLSIVGLVLILIALFGIHRRQPFPGWWALLPVTGTCLLILSGPAAWVNRNILARPLLVWVGLISYPLYLWHWPLLSFARIVEMDKPSSSIRAATVGISFVLAWLTYRLIEKPVRFGRVSWRKTALLCMLAVLVGYAGYNVYQRDGFSFRMKDRQSYLDHFDSSKYFIQMGISEKYKDECNFYNVDKPTIPLEHINPACYQKAPGKDKTIFLWGDSNAQQLYFGLSKNLPADWQIMIVASSGCVPNIELADSSEKLCVRSNWFALKNIKEAQPDIVLIAQVRHHSFEKMEEISRVLKSLGVNRVIAVGPTPYWKADLPRIIARRLWSYTPRYYNELIDAKLINKNTLLASKSKLTTTFEFVSLMDFFCNDSGCLTYIGDDRMTGVTSWDSGHLTPIASDYLAKEYLSKFILGSSPN